MNDTEINYVWVDEDGDQVSPRHRKFTSAMSFVTAWNDRWARIIDRWGSIESAPRQLRDSLTRTGKQPVELKRVVVRYDFEPLSEAEETVVKVMLHQEEMD